jgi:signal transduction histidine kinase
MAGGILGTRRCDMPRLTLEAPLTTITNNISAREIIHGITGDPTTLELAPQSDWRPLNESEHVVQFYETDAFLLDALSQFIGIGLATGDACIVVATPSHRAGLDERLQATGLDVARARASGQYIALDAAETLSTFMVGGSPEPGRFAATLGDMITQAAEGRRQVRVFGEMVALLWAEGEHDAALRLEGLWNDLRGTHAFMLFCAYPIGGFGEEASAASLGDVCAAHTRAIPAESYTTLANPQDRLREIVLLQQKAQSLEAEIAERKAAEASLRAVKDQLEVQVEDLRRLHEMSLRLTSTLDIESVLHEILQAALAVQGTDLGLLSLRDPQRDGLKPQASRGLDDVFLREVAWVPPGGGACGRCYTQREQVVVEDVEVDPIFAEYRQAARVAGLRAVHSTPLLTGNGTIIGVLSVYFRQPHRPSTRETQLMDIYTRMAADSIENARLYQEAQNAIRARDQFLSIAAHELKTPLTSLLGNAQLVERRAERDGSFTGPAAKAVRTIAQQAKRLNKMILALLDVSRIETGRLDIERVPMDLCGLVRRVVEEIQPTLDKQSVDCLTPTGALMIDGDEVRMEQVVQNLLANAIKYSPSGGPVVVRVERRADQACLMVTDVGLGISEHDQRDLFRPFYRASNTDTRYVSGMGIGLYVVREIVSLHDGTVAVESREGEGSTFSVCLPLVAGHDPT